MFEVPFPHPVISMRFPTAKARLLYQPAVLYCAWIHDSPIEEWVSQGRLYGRAGYECYLIFYECSGGVVSRQYYGLTRWTELHPLVTEKYEYYKSEIEANVPAVKTYIDIRTTEQLLNDCCPPMLYW